MTATIRRSLAARQDLIDIWLTIALDNEAAADLMLDRIEDAIRRLADFPQLGPSREDLFFGARVILRRPYLVIYRFQSEPRQVDIVRVIDARRDLEAIFHD